MSNLQCVFSKCFPQLYEETKSPCTLTAFHTYRALRDHIWKYHSKLLSCDKCGHRFASAKRKNEHKDELKALKWEHDKQCHPDGDEGRSLDSDLMIITLSEDGDQKIKSWKENRKKSDEQNYQSLCRSLFGDAIRVPADIGVDYWVPKHKIDREYSYRALGEQNLADARWRQLAPPSSFATTSYQCLDPVAAATATATTWAPTYHHHHHHGGVSRLALDRGDDNNTQVCDWLVPTRPSDVDSGFYSGGGGDGLGHTPAMAAPAPDDGSYYTDLNQAPQDVVIADVVMGSDCPGPAPGSSAEDAPPARLDINFDFELDGYDDSTDDDNYDNTPI